MDEKEIVREILHDVRENVLFNTNEASWKIWKNDSQSRMNEYHKYQAIFKSDAERWPDTLNSYKKYECFSTYELSDDNYLIYNKNNKEIRIPADVLNNVDTIINLANQYEEWTSEETNVINAFCLVSYTIGAFCPIWHNPSPGRCAYTDIVWAKLLKSGLYDEYCNIKRDYVGIENRENSKTVRGRKDIDLFMILPSQKGIQPVNIISKLYFQDYFNFKWKPICQIITTKFEKGDYLSERENVFDFIQQITILTVQRSYRIITNYQGNVLREKDKQIIHEALKSIGLDAVECIYSKKKRKLIYDK